MCPELHKIRKKLFSEKNETRVIHYAACTLQYFPIAKKAGKETKAGCGYSNKQGSEGKFTNEPILCYKTWDCHNIYLVANKVSFPFYIRQGFKLMSKLKEDKTVDWREVKKN
eukprot:12435778-Ditylum_brightwellii.AAC.1